jgi:beta-galactosidase
MHRSTRIILQVLGAALVLGQVRAAASVRPVPPRKVLSLDGAWQVEQGGLERPPAIYTHEVTVPGLVDMAKPSFDAVGRKSNLRQAFWYRRTFKLAGPVPEVAMLKLNKACYGTQVYLNGQYVGEHLPCFTPGYFDLKPHLRGSGQENELIVRLGAHRESLPPGMPTGWDFEKALFIPGLYDSVELILTSAPYIVNIQTAPDVEAGKVRVVAEIDAGSHGGTVSVRADVREARSGRGAGTGQTSVSGETGQCQKADVTIPIRNCRPWSPDDPFLYELTVSTGSDAARVRFGMRSFRFEAGDKYAVLNGQRIFLRGSNFTMYRFFEDAQRGDRPWRAEWVRRLHRKVKWMHWNALRYCIGFPPEMWYDIADEEGILIQDEFPIWTLGEDPEKLDADKIVPEYREWMRERWNHPCVVLWDAQNESSITATSKALQQVRSLDLSNRPWENGWAEPQSETDCVEAHPYLFIRDWSSNGKDRFRMNELAKMDGRPGLNDSQGKRRVPILINEYGWLWLTRDGYPTCLTDKVYEHLLGSTATVDQRRQTYARLLAAKTEFWRCHRECAGVLHFCMLGYSRPGDKPRPEGGATSDHWIDLEGLTLEPHFVRYVRDAFSPVGVMLDFWDDTLVACKPRDMKVYIINDLAATWKGTVRLSLVKGAKVTLLDSQACAVAGFGREILTFNVLTPPTAGDAVLVAELMGPRGPSIRSQRDVKVVPQIAPSLRP